MSHALARESAVIVSATTCACGNCRAAVFRMELSGRMTAPSSILHGLYNPGAYDFEAYGFNGI